jgi:hypothetical protein
VGNEFTTSGLVNEDTVSSVTLSSAGAAKMASVASYDILPSAAVGTGLTNYKIAYNSGKLTVDPKALTITADNQSKVYWAPLPALTASYDGFVNGDTATSLTTPPILATTGLASSPVGTYPITASGAVDANYSITFVAGTLTVTPASTVTSALVTGVNEGSSSAVFSASVVAQNPSGAIVNEGTVKFEVLNGDVSVGSVVTGTVSGGTASAPFDPSALSPGTYTVMVTYQPEVSAANFARSGGQISLVVSNVSPLITNMVASSYLVPVGTTITATGTFSHSGSSSAITATWTWDDDTSGLGTISGHSVTDSHKYSAPGVYTVGLRLEDKFGGFDERKITEFTQYVVVYDPSGGFATGGGWINSPLTACRWANCTDETVGKATFGFTSKYQKGANVPTGNTEFQFQAGKLNFHSTSYQWLVVSGSQAQFKGVGTINGSGNYGFLITAVDGELRGSKSSDQFRIKIWSKNPDDSDGGVVYDNQMGQKDDSGAATVLGGGSIVIHN